MARFGEREEQAEYERRYAVVRPAPREHEGMQRSPEAIAFDAMTAREWGRFVAAVPDEERRRNLGLKHVLARPRRGAGYVCRCGWKTERTDYHALQADHLIEVAQSTP